MKIKNVVIIVLVLVVILLVGGIYHAGKISPELLPAQTATTTTITTTTVIPGAVPSTYYTAGTYHNSVYGLSLNLPASYQPFDTGSSPAGVVASDSIQFAQNGVKVFTVNVFTKQQWNVIRTQENTEHLNVNDLGEGNYLGENETYIFSATIFTNTAEAQSILSTIKYY